MSTERDLLDLAMVKLREARADHAEAAEAWEKRAELFGVTRLVVLAGELQEAERHNTASVEAWSRAHKGASAFKSPENESACDAVDRQLNVAQTRLCAAQDAWMAAGLSFPVVALDSDGGRT